MHEDEMLEQIEELVDICADVTVEADELDRTRCEITNIKDDLRRMMEKARQVLNLSTLTVLDIDQLYVYDLNQRVLQYLKVKDLIFDGEDVRFCIHDLQNKKRIPCLCMDLIDLQHEIKILDDQEFVISTDLNTLIKELSKRDLIKRTPLKYFESIQPNMVLYRESVNAIFKTCPDEPLFPTTWEEPKGFSNQMIRIIPKAFYGVPYGPGFEILDIDFIQEI